MNQQVVNGVAPQQLLFVGDEIKYLEQLIDETPTKYGKHLLNLLNAVKQKRALEARQAQELYIRQQQEAQAAFLKQERKSKRQKKTAPTSDQNTEGRV